MVAQNAAFPKIWRGMRQASAPIMVFGSGTAEGGAQVVVRVPPCLPCGGCAWADPSAHDLRNGPPIQGGSCTAKARDVFEGPSPPGLRSLQMSHGG